MLTAVVVSAGATGLAVWLLVGPSARLGTAVGRSRVGVRRPAAPGTPGAVSGTDRGDPPAGDQVRGGSRRVDPPLHSGPPAWQLGSVPLVAGVAAWVVVGGWLGFGLGVAAVVGLPPAIRRMERGAVRRRRLALVRAAPLAADLLGAALTAGVPLERAVPVVAGAIGGPLGAALATVHDRVGLGEPSASAWGRLAAEPGLGVIARCVARSARTGAPLAGLLASAADDLRAAATAASLAQVRAVSVRAVLPLGLCLLPAFTLLGIVPVVAGLLPRG
jgi:hypothetical protein